MPVISLFYGIIIYMYAKDHPAPHFHARYQDEQAIYDLEGNLLEGHMPKRQDRLISAWAEIHHDDLIANWDLAERGEQPMKIDPIR